MMLIAGLAALGMGATYAAGRWQERRSWQPLVQGKKGSDPERIRSMIEYRTAIHEAGHVVCAWRNPYVKRITRVTIDPEQEGYRGHVNFLASAVDHPAAKWYQIMVNLGGLAAEAHEFGRLRSGGSRLDLEKARDAAKAIVRAGSPKAPWSNPGLRVEDKRDRIVATMFRNLDSRDVIAMDQAKIKQVTEYLCSKGDLGPKEVRAIFGKRPFTMG